MTKLYIFISAWMTLTFFKFAVVEEMKIFSVHFFTNLSIVLDYILYVVTTCWFVKAHAQFLVHK